MYLRALKELVNGALVNANSDPLLDARYNTFVSEGLTVRRPIPSRLISPRRATGIAATVAASDTNALAVAGSSFTTSNDFLTISGAAPLQVTTITINGEPRPMTWTSATGWSIRLAVPPGTNAYTLLGYDRFGNLVSGASNQVTIASTAGPVSPVGNVLINEIMYNPATPNAEYVELYNSSTNAAFDLSGWRINGLSYTFPSGSFIGPNSFLVLARSRGAFISTYGLSVPIFDTFSGGLQSDGETLTLIQPGATPAQDLVVDKVRYESVAPWPVNADGTPITGALQVIDPRQERSRVANWASTLLWRYATVTGTIGSSRLLVYQNGLGDAFIDDMKLVYGPVAEAGANLIANGDFESPLAPNWVLPASNGSQLEQHERAQRQWQPAHHYHQRAGHAQRPLSNHHSHAHQWAGRHAQLLVSNGHGNADPHGQAEQRHGEHQPQHHAGNCLVSRRHQYSLGLVAGVPAPLAQ